MSLHTLPSARPYNPTTFQERGVAVPFTTPLLGGARARLSRNRGLELIVRHPGGGHGVYVMPWSGITALCRPTLYDKVVSSRIALLETVTPATVRSIARTAAAEGLAGEGAMRAAQAAAKSDQADRRVVVNHLLSSLIRQVNDRLNASPIALGTGAPDLGSDARQTVAWLAQSLGQPAGWGAKALDAIADAMTTVGISGGEVGRIPGLVRSLAAMREQIAEWIRAQRDGDRVSFAHTVYSISDLTSSLAVGLIAQARMLTDDMVGLMRHWATDPESVIGVAARPEWVLDGWEQICLIWNYAQDNAARRVALVEAVHYLPPMPRELNEWGGGTAKINDVFAEHGDIMLIEDWHTGPAMFDLIARNEQLRAAAS